MLFHKVIGFGVALTGAILSGCVPQPPDQATTPPVGTQILQGAYTLRGMTSDGWIVYTDNATLTMHAIPIAGGSAQDIVAVGDSFAISVWGKTVFVWSHKNQAAVGPLTVWTAGDGPRTVSTSSLAPWVAATEDGSRVLYLDNVDATGKTGDLVAAGAGGASPQKILMGLDGLSNEGCQAWLGFAGSYALAAHCSAGATRPTISSFDASWRQTSLVAQAAVPWATDPAGTMVLTATDAGTVVVPIGGGPMKVIDPAGSTGMLVDNGQTAIYGTMMGGLRRSPVSSPSPMTLVGSGVGGFYGVSPDGRFALYYNKIDYTTLVSDVYLTSTTMPGATTTLCGTQTGGIFGDAFTADGSHVLYATDVDATSHAMTLNAIAPGDAAPTVLGTRAWEIWATTGAKVVYTDHYDWTGLRGHADLRTADTSQGGAASLVVNQADTEVFLSPAHDKVVYTWSLDDSPRVGIYVAELP